MIMDFVNLEKVQAYCDICALPDLPGMGCKWVYTGSPDRWRRWVGLIVRAYIVRRSVIRDDMIECNQPTAISSS